jgi:putative ABC transport system permease protein
MDTLRQDFQAAIRSLKRSPGFSAVVVLTLAIAIGPMTAIFSVVDAVLLRPPPFENPDRIVQLWTGEGPAPHGPVSSANFVDWRAMSHSFDAMAAEDFAWFNLTSAADGTRPERLRGALVSPGFFRALGVRPVLGRGLTADDEQPRTHVAILSHSLWTGHFAGDRHVIGREILLDGVRWHVVGVMPPGFTFPGPLVQETIDLWAPLAWAPNELQRGMRRYGVTARLRPGVTVEQAQADLDRVAARLAADYPADNANTRLRLVPIRTELAGNARRALLVLLGAGALLLLVACANAANLMLARASTRQHELTIRIALGAGRQRIVRQLLTESVVLSAIAAAAGALAAVWITALYATLIPAASRADVALDGRVLAFLVTVTVVTGLAFGSAPAWRASTVTIGESLRRDGRSTTAGRGRRSFSSSLVILEVATAVVLLVGAGLLVRSFDRLTNVDPGFDARGVYTTRIVLPSERYADEVRTRRFMDDGLARLRDLRGVANAGAVDYLPFGQSDFHIGMTIDGQETAPRGEVSAHYRSIAGEYLTAMHIPLLRGRAFTTTDVPNAPLVALVSEAMARRYWPNESPLGHRIRLGNPTDRDPSPWMTVVGIVGDVKHWSFTEKPEPMLYVSLEQQPARSFSFVARLDAERASTVAAVRDVLYSVDPEQPVSWQPLRNLLDSSVAEPRFRSVFIAAFAFVALTLAIVGLYGLISFGVTQRTRELGVRVALGARRGDIIGLVLQEGVRLAAIGVAVGVVAAFAATRLLVGMLYQVSPTDVATFVVVPVLLLATATVANYLPARRAAAIDPVTALQSG